VGTVIQYAQRDSEARTNAGIASNAQTCLRSMATCKPRAFLSVKRRRSLTGSVAKLPFGGRIRKWDLGKSMTWGPQLSCFRCFATEPDQVIGARQKHKGMSWSLTGSKALGILKVVELNQQWEQLWFPQQAAA